MAAEALQSTLPTHPDLIRITPEKNSIKIEVIRDLLGRLSLKPMKAPQIVVILEDCDTMTTGAANALLKTLEEPPPDVVFFLLTSRAEELPDTIRSRCQKVRFQISSETLRKDLQTLYESWETEIAPLWPSPSKPFATASQLSETIKEEKERLDSIFQILKALWHDIAVLKIGGDPSFLLIPSAQKKLEALSARKSSKQIFDDMDLILETERALDGNVNKMLALERLFYNLIR